MDLDAAVRGRKMTRAFLPDPVPDEVVAGLFERALAAPSAGFAQGAEFLVLTDPDRRARFWSLVGDPEWTDRSPLAERLVVAPVIALCLTDPERYEARYGADDKRGSSLAGSAPDRWPVPYPEIDAAFATMVVLLGAEAARLGALFFHLQNRERAVLDGLGVPGRYRTIGAVALGWPAAATVARARSRRSPAARIHRDHHREEPS